MTSTRAFDDVRLVLFTDFARHPDSSALVRLCALARPGSVVVVLRDRTSSFRDRFAWGKQLRPVIGAAGQRFVVADRSDLGRALAADGLHLGAEAISPMDGRLLVGSGWLSRGHHGLERLAAAELDALDVVFVSPVFEARKGRPALGSEGLGRSVRSIAERAPHVRAFALGGVDAERVPEALGAGVGGVAVIGAAYDSPPEPLLDALGIARSTAK